MPAKPWDHEATLLMKLRVGDETAFAELVDQLHSRLVAMARAFTSPPALAEDIAQETWLAVIRGLRTSGCCCTVLARAFAASWIDSFEVVLHGPSVTTGAKRRRMNCHEAIDVMGDVLVGSVEGPTLAAFLQHVQECGACGTYY